MDRSRNVAGGDAPPGFYHNSVCRVEKLRAENSCTSRELRQKVMQMEELLWQLSLEFESKIQELEEQRQAHKDLQKKYAEKEAELHQKEELMKVSLDEAEMNMKSLVEANSRLEAENSNLKEEVQILQDSLKKLQDSQQTHDEKLEVSIAEAETSAQDAATALQMISLPEPERNELLQYFHYLTLDPDTANPRLVVSEDNRVVRYVVEQQSYSDHADRFDSYYQVLCKESVCGRNYWEVQWSPEVVEISVSYKEISRKGRRDECGFGCNTQSWCLRCSAGPDSVSFLHNNIETHLRVLAVSRIGVYVDHSEGTLSFYSVTDQTMWLIHRVHTTFTQPLYAGFWMYGVGSSVRLCDLK